MDKIAALIKLAVRLEEEGHPAFADAVERMARVAASFDIYAPQNVVQQGWQAAGGGSTKGDLGGYHVRLQQQGQAPAASVIPAVLSMMPAIASGRFSGPQISQVAAKYRVDPQMLSQALQTAARAYSYGVRSPADISKFLSSSGQIDLQVASQSPGGAFGSWGLNSADIMHHERRHQQGATAGIQDYLRIANPGADFPAGGTGGGVRPAYDKWVKKNINSFMAGRTSPEEYGANLPLWEKAFKKIKPEAN